MKVFKFEITLSEHDLVGDEFWEGALERDGTGIAELTEALAQAIEDSNLIVNSERTPKEVVKLVSFQDIK